MRLGRVANAVCTVRQHVLEQNALVELRAADQKVVRWPFATFVLPPRFTQPFAVGLEPASCQHAGFGCDAFAAHIGSDEATVLNVEFVDWGVVTNLNAKFFSAAKVGVDEGFATAHEKRIGASHVHSARQRWLKVHTVLAHPIAAGG